MKLNKVFAWIIVGIVLFASAPFMLVLIWPRINEVRTGGTPEYPEIQPQRFDAVDYDQVYQGALETTKSLGWEIREANRAQGVIEAIATISLIRIKDDVTINLTREGGAVVVNVRSRSRIGKTDFGVNARRIRRFQADLAKRF